ncbi:MAG: hypothetical protein ABH810_00225 [bacterium]
MKKLLVFLAIIILPSFAFAADISTGELITVEKEQRNPIIFASDVKVKSDISGDLTSFSSTARIENKIDGSAYVFAGRANISSPEIANRLVVFGGEVDVSGNIKGDLIVFGGTVNIDSSSIVDGDIFAYGGNVYINGRTSGSLRAGGGKVMLEGAVIEKDAQIKSDQILISENSLVKGKLSYWSAKEGNFPEGVIKGAVEFNKIKKESFSRGYSVISSLVMAAFLALAVLFLFGKRLEGIVTLAYEKFGTTLLAGFLVAIVLPLALIILLISYVGITFALAILFVYIAAWFFAYAYGAILTGSAIIRWLSKSKTMKVDWSAAIIGVLALVLVGYIPIVGGIVSFLVMLTGMGMVYSQLKELRSSK